MVFAACSLSIFFRKSFRHFKLNYVQNCRKNWKKNLYRGEGGGGGSEKYLLFPDKFVFYRKESRNAQRFYGVFPQQGSCSTVFPQDEAIGRILTIKVLQFCATHLLLLIVKNACDLCRMLGRRSRHSDTNLSRHRFKNLWER